MQEFEKISDTTFKRNVQQIYSLPNLKRQIEMIQRQMYVLQSRKLELEKIQSEAEKIGVTDNVKDNEIK
jgi:hypothetical protein